MSDANDRRDQKDQEAPVLVEIGEAQCVVLGGGGKGFDGFEGLTDVAFEFEADDNE